MNKGLTLEKAWAITLKKWSKPSDDLYKFVNPNNCGLCQKFHEWKPAPSYGAKCTGCPIARVTKKPACQRFTGYTRMIKLRDKYVTDFDKIEAIRKHGLEKLIQIKAKSEGL